MALSRSEVMARNKSRNTQPEVLLRKALYARGLRYRLHHKTPVGRPDVVFPGPRVAVFVDGCFWHGCPAHYSRPRTRHEFWQAKRRENLDRDRRQTLQLQDAGWTVLRLMECQVWEALDTCVAEVEAAVRHQAKPSRGIYWRVASVEPSLAEDNVETRYLEDLYEGTQTRTETGRRVTAKAKRK